MGAISESSVTVNSFSVSAGCSKVIYYPLNYGNADYCRLSKEAFKGFNIFTVVQSVLLFLTPSLPTKVANIKILLYKDKNWNFLNIHILLNDKSYLTDSPPVHCYCMFCTSMKILKTLDGLYLIQTCHGLSMLVVGVLFPRNI